MFKNLLIAAAAALTAVSSFAASGDLPSNDSIAVEINGVKISLAEVDQKRQTSMYQARSNYFETARRVLEEFVDDYLLEQQAKKENVTVTQLLERHVNSAIPPDPSEEILRF